MSITEASNATHDMAWAKTIGDALYQAYPYPHLWQVEVQDRVATIRNLYLSSLWGYRYHLTGYWKVDWPILRRQAGELLERFSLTRGRVSVEDILRLKRDFAGRPQGDLT